MGQREIPREKTKAGLWMPFTTPLCLLCLSAVLGACTPLELSERGGEEFRGLYTVIFDKNGGDTAPVPTSITLKPPATSLSTLPTQPERAGHQFMGWNTQRDGSGTPFVVGTVVEANTAMLVYAQWARVEVSPSESVLTPLEWSHYSERFTTFQVRVSGFQSLVDAQSAKLAVLPVRGLAFNVVGNVSKDAVDFSITVEYDGNTVLEDTDGWASPKLQLTLLQTHVATFPAPRMAVMDGRTKNRPILVRQDNLLFFNGFARNLGRRLHYKLVENVSLPLGNTSNWVPIGANNNAFTGSFDGGGFTLKGLSLQASGDDYQGLFGVTGPGAVVENLGLAELNVRGKDNVGGLVGLNGGTVRNCHATGSVNSSGNNVGGLVGRNEGMVQNCYAMGNVNGSSVSGSGSSHVGGLVGNNPGTVHSCHATSGVIGSGEHIGGLVGHNAGKVQNSYARGSVNGSRNFIGGLLGYNNKGTVQHCYATGSVTGSASGNNGWHVGGLLGYNNAGTVQECYAMGSVSGNTDVGGLVGYNYNKGTVQNCVALNPSVKAANALYVGRVSGCNDAAYLVNNQAFSGIAGHTWNNTGPNNLDGESRTATQLKSTTGFPAPLRVSPWSYQAGSLPVLEGLWGQSAAMPGHIQ